MRKAKSILSLLLAAVLTINTVPVSASAAGVKSAQNQPKTVAVPQTVMVQADLPAEAAVDDSEEMFRLYAEQAFAEAAGQEMIMPYGTTAGDRLKGVEKVLYNGIKAKVEAVADGQLASTTFALNSEVEKSVFAQELKWSKEDLGITGEFAKEEGGLTDETNYAISAKMEPHLNAVVMALLADCPKDLYWFNKSAWYLYGGTVGYQGDSIWYMDVQVIFTPLDAYKGAQDYTVDTTKTGATQNAINNAKAIVQEAESANLSDQEILKKYKDKIVELTSYDGEAVDELEKNNKFYSDSWQLIWVFDNDENTNVVCEGYSKAFQFLCDLSTSWNDGNTIFDDENFKCYSVTGNSSNGVTVGAHMWNVVNLNGINYIVDVTNCDEGTLGGTSWQPLFMTYVYASDTEGSTHTIDCSENKQGTEGWLLTYKYFEYEKDLHCDGYLRLGPAPLEVDSTNPVSIPASTVGTPITPVDISGKISGGKKPYSYAITEPTDSWLTISADGKINGTPTAVAEASNITVTITDADGKTTTMRISVGEVTRASAKQDLKWTKEPTTTATYGDSNIKGNTATNRTEGGSSDITYSSSNAKVATVNASTGEVTIIGVGTTTITATVASTEFYEKTSIDYTLKVNPADYTYTFPTTLRVRKGSAVSAIGHGENRGAIGKKNEAVSGTLYWYKDEACTTAVTDNDLATVGTVPLYGKFVPDGTNTNYVTTEKKSTSPTSVQVMDVSFSVSGEETTDSATVKKMNTTYGYQWKNILRFYTGLKASYNGVDDANLEHFDFLIGTERKLRSEIGETYPDAGTYPYEVVYNGTIGSETFTNVIVCSGSVNISPKTLEESDLEFTGNPEKIFDGTTKSSMTVSVKSSSLVKEEDSVTIKTNAYYDDMNAGSEKTITFTVSEDVTGNYALAAGSTFTVNDGKITPKAVTATRVGDEAITKVYDGNTNVTTALKFTIPKAGTTSDTITITTSGNTYASADVGENLAITLGNKTASGENLDNYDITYPALTGKITPKAVTATRVGNEAITKEYDGNTNVTTDLKFSIPKAGTTGETITITTSGNTYASANAGETIGINLGTKSGSENLSNYTITYPALTGKITPKAVTAIRIGDTEITKEYDGNTIVTTEIRFGILAGATASQIIYITTSGNTYASANAGDNIAITLGTKTAEGGENLGNYKITYPELKGKITPKKVTVTLGGDPSGVTYKEGGPTLTATYIDVHGQTKSDVTLTKTPYTSDGPQWPNAGNYILSAVIKDQNYQASSFDPADYLIDKATLQAVMNTIKDVRYNDSALKTVTARDLGIEAAGRFVITGRDDSNSILKEVTGLATGGFTYQIKDSLTEQNGKDKLTATIKVKFIPSNTNYATISNIPVTIRLTEKEAINDITLTMADSVYGTETADPQASTGAAGGSWSYVYTGNYTDGSETLYASTSVKPSLPGHYTVTATYESATHKGSKSATFTIAPKQLTYTGLTVEDKTYNGTKTAKVTGTLAYAGFVGTDGNNVGAPAAIDGAVFTYADEKVGNGKTVSVSGYTPGVLTGEDAWKYLAPESLELKGNILAPTAPVVTGTENEDSNKTVTNSTIEENFDSYNEQVQELYADAAALKSAMKVAAQKANADLGANLQFYHLRIQKATNDGLTDVIEPTDILLPYPENTGKEGYDFVVVQMKEDGTMETIQPTKGEYGLSLTLSYGGPVSIAWCRSAAPVQPDAPNNNGGSSNGGSNNGGSATNNGTTAGGNSNSSSNSNGSATLIEVSKVNTAAEKTSVPTSDNAGSAMLTASAEAVLALAALGVIWFFRKRRAW